MILVLLIATLLIVSAFVIYNKVSESVKVDREIKFLNILKINIVDYYNIQSSYSNISANILISNNMIDKRNIDDSNIVDFLGSNFEISSYNSGKGFSFKISNISTSYCMKLIPSIQNSFTLINDTTASTLSPTDFYSLCSNNDLTLTHSTTLKAFANTGIAMNGLQIAVYHTVNKANGNSITADNYLSLSGINFGLSIFESNKKSDSLIKYLMSSQDTDNQAHKNESSTGYTYTSCGSFANSSSCGNLTVDGILNAIISAPDELKQNVDITIDGTSENMTKMCESFTCTQGYNKNGALVTYIKSK